LEPSAAQIDGNLMSEDLRVLNQEEERTMAQSRDCFAPKVRIPPELVIRKSERPRKPKILPSMLAEGLIKISNFTL
jgi:hypothetical protein